MLGFAIARNPDHLDFGFIRELPCQNRQQTARLGRMRFGELDDLEQAITNRRVHLEFFFQLGSALFPSERDCDNLCIVQRYANLII